MTIGKSIKRHRQERDMRQCDLAKALGVNQCVVSFWESERCEPTLFYAICLADVFGITLDELVGRTVAK